MAESEKDKPRSAPLKYRPYGRVYGEVWDPAERSWSVLIHLSAFLFPIVPSLLIWLVTRGKSDMADYHGKRSVNFQVSFILYDLILISAMAPVFIVSSRPGVEDSDLTGLLFLFVVALIFLFIFGIIWIIWTIDAAIHAGRGDAPGYILAIPFLR